MPRLPVKQDYWLCYILRCGDGSLYTGITCRLLQRLKQHNNGIGAKYTRSRLPVTLVAGSYPDTSKTQAMRLEHLIKKLSKDDKERLVKDMPLGTVESLVTRDVLWIRSNPTGCVRFSLLMQYR